MATSALLRKIEGLVTLDPDARDAVAALPVERTGVRRRGDVLRLGEQPGALYVVESGWAARYGLRIDGSRRITGVMLAGDFCGIHAIAGAALDHAVTALSACEIGRIRLAEVERLVADFPVIGQALWRSKLVDEATLRRWLLMAADSFQAVGHLLCELHARADAAGLVRDGRCELPLTQTDIADAVGITPVHTNRVIKRLRTEGLIRLSEGVLEIEDVDALRRAIRFDGQYLRPWGPGVAAEDQPARTKWEQYT